MLRNIFAAAILSFGCIISSLAGATVVQFQIAGMGTIEVNLYDQRTPATVANFLDYVDSGAWNNTVIHRSAAGFVIQGGGYTSSGGLPLSLVPTNPAVTNEPVFSNVRGTIAMAKIAGDPDSATSQWYFNLGDNSASLDPQNGGFTVFGEVMDTGMVDVVDAIAALPVFNAGGALSTLPLRNYTSQDASDGKPVTDENLVLVTAIVVIDAAADTAASLSPAENTLIDDVPAPAPPPSSGGGGGGGAVGLASLMLLLTAEFARRGAFAARRRRWVRIDSSRR